MKRLVIISLIALASVARAQDFTNATKSVTWTNVTVLRNVPGETNTEIRVRGDGSRWHSAAIVSGTNESGQARTVEVALDIGKSAMLKALNETAGVVATADTSNVVKRFDRLLLKAFTKDANRALDQLQ